MSEQCAALHSLCNRMTRYHFDNWKTAPANGVYIFFEEGEHAHGGDRIVRIGTHETQDRLPGRLSMHFSAGLDMSGSSFRQDICRALLQKQYGPVGVEKWEAGEFDYGRETAIISEVTEYIRKKMSFVVFEITDARRDMESKLISTVSSCEECKPSAVWLGRFSPKKDIAESGLWQVEGLYKPLTNEDLSVLERSGLIMSSGQ
ncbi:hypothetical protein AGMMS50267_13210 [Spirochaetia bacterium]|nr:hypothetical protein AGMMS50267_13210 [Spirochaetia bacterium]